ncbi:Hcp family type VI secretion system effector [Agaribacterium haliotis]|uniref:Hcp family type VI secretion system effector n=1 Tax=Agaribacterium haliotis TaxID=2013869 RepID=UPI000BB53833|nr:type VI secretion system tube protein Hcp [Agaribacterium haliotis]
MQIYVLHDGIKGNVTADGFKDHYKAESFNFGVSRALSMTTGSTANRESDNPTLSEVTLTKLADNSATELFKDSVGGGKGAQGKDVVIKFVQTGSKGDEVFMEYTLKNSMVSSYNVSAHGTEPAIETFTLNYTEIMISFSDYDSGNAQASPQRVGYNVEKTTVL